MMVAAVHIAASQRAAPFAAAPAGDRADTTSSDWTPGRRPAHCHEMVFAVAPRMDPDTEQRPTLQRARGLGQVRVTARGLDRLYQEGCAKVRFPRTPGSAAPEAVLINTAGGLTGGDQLNWDVALGAGARLTVSTQACEKVYRARDGVAQTTVHLSAEAGARLEWLPQETILFDAGALSRRIEADVAADAALLVLEAVILGRAAMGESVRRGRLRDRWRIRRNGQLVFADELRLEGAIQALAARAPVLAGAAAFASLLLVSPDADGKLDAVRDAIGPLGGASAFDGLLFARVASPDGLSLRRALLRAMAALRDGEPAPRLWGT